MPTAARRYKYASLHPFAESKLYFVQIEGKVSTFDDQLQPFLHIFLSRFVEISLPLWSMAFDTKRNKFLSTLKQRQ